jgi:hypothetical protein
LIVDGIWNDDLVDYGDEDKAIRVGRQAIAQFVAEVEEIDSKVRQKITSLKRDVMEFTPEWDVLYSKYYEEEMSRRGF